MSKLVLRSARLLALTICLILSHHAYASHFFGCDLTYKWVSGYTYTITMTVYGDCSGTAFPTLPTSTPEIKIYNGSTVYKTISLSISAPSKGVEVSPVCPRDTDSTTCRGGTVPGITKFVYTGNVTLSGTSANWAFVFDGSMGISATAGRSAGITNLSSAGVTELVDSLNNLNEPNSSPILTVIPTPFFCDNEPANYNPGGVDSASGDSLVFKLVPGLDPTTGTVSYAAGYSATSPLAVSSGTFSFNSGTGQISFTPNILQKSLVVEQVDQYRNDTLVGTIMREMTFIVLNCNNTPPSGKISNVSAGSIIDSTDMSICSSADSFSFNINPVDPDSADITITSSGLPSGATFAITGNGTLTPKGKFSWNTFGVKPGTYNFFLTYVDDACPLSSRQTQAYSVIVLPPPNISVARVSLATCAKKAVYTFTPSGTDTPWNIYVYKGTTAIDSFKKITTTTAVTDSFSPGTYTIRLYNKSGCFTDSVLVVALPPLIIPSATFTTPTCVGDSNGSIIITASGGLAPYKYSLGAGPFSTTNKFTGLKAGSYTFHILDSNACVKDTIVVLPDPPAILAKVAFSRPPCNHFQNGSISIKAYNSIGPYEYALDTGLYNDSGIFHNLYSGPYTVHIQNAIGCLKDTIVVLPDSIKISTILTIVDELCYGGNNASIVVKARGGYGPPYKYSFNSGPLNSTYTYTNLYAGSYTIHVQDTVLCHWDSTVTIKQPGIISWTNGIKNVDCYLNASGSDTIHTSGGIPPYLYSFNGGPFTTSNIFSGLKAGTYVVTIKDSNSCSQTDTFTITQPALLVVSNITIVQPLCHGNNNGYFVITASGGTPPYQYAINTSTFSLNDTLNNLSTGTYTLHIKDSNNCTRDTVVFMPEPSPVAVSASVTQSVCNTLDNGIVILYPSGGTPGYTFAVGTGTYSASDTFRLLAADTYAFHVRDSNLCVKDTVITITDSFHLSQALKETDALCFDSSSGIVVITPKGGVSPYTYMITPPGTVSSIDTFAGLHAGTYVTRITDTNGCIYDTAVTIGQPTIIIPSASFTQPSCYGYKDGSITISATGGTAPYTYALNAGPFSTSTAFSGDSARLDTLWVKDINGCNYDTLINVTQPTPLFFDSLILSNVRCFGDSSGHVRIVASGGTPAYKYAANSSLFQTDSVLTGLYVGNQVIRLKDSHNCLLDSTIQLTQPSQLHIVIDSLTEPTCQYYTDGKLVIRGAGGVAPYMFSTDNSTYNYQTVYPNLAEGVYAFWITDSNNCVRDTSVTLVGYPHIIISDVNIQAVTCNNFQDGKIILNVTGGVQPLTYSIDGYHQVSTYEFDSVLAGTYTIEITDSKNCKKDTTLQMPQPDKLSLTATINPNQCIGPDTMGQARIDVTGGTQPYSYIWSNNPGNTSNELNGMPNGNYEVWVHDANNCTDSALMTIRYDDCCKPFIPDAFTPNGDGKNDVFRIRFKGDMRLEEFSIYNRFGQQVFHTTYVQQGWDGTFNGVPQDLGTYFYYIKAWCGYKEDHEVTFKGDVTLIR